MGGKVLTEDEENVIEILIRTFSAISVVFLLVGISMMLYLRQYKKPHHRLVLILFLCLLPSVLQQTIIVAAWTENSAFCVFTGFVDQVGMVSACAWFLVITINLYRMLVLLVRVTNRDLLIEHWLVWSWSLMMGFLPLTTNSYSSSGAWCWISGGTDAGKAWRFITLYGPMLVQFVVIGALCIAIAVSLYRHRVGGGISSRAKEMAFFLFLYPLTFIACWLPAVINRYYSLATGDQVFGLFVAHIIGNTLLPTVCVLVYGWSSFRLVFQRLTGRDSFRSTPQITTSSSAEQSVLES